MTAAQQASLWKEMSPPDNRRLLQVRDIHLLFEDFDPAPGVEVTIDRPPHRKVADSLPPLADVLRFTTCVPFETAVQQPGWSVKMLARNTGHQARQALDLARPRPHGRDLEQPSARRNVVRVHQLAFATELPVAKAPPTGSLDGLRSMGEPLRLGEPTLTPGSPKVC